MRFLRPLLLAVFAILVALGPATAPAAAAKRAKASKPTITRVTPMRLEIGQTLTIRGRNFKAKKGRNTVIFKGSDGRTAFAKPRSATKRKLVVKVPAGVARLLIVKDGKQRPTRMQLRVLAGRFSAFTPRRLSPVLLTIGANTPGGGEGKPLAACNKTSDHDGDLLPNQLELAIGTNPCLLDTDGDGIEDGYEYQSALDLNDDESQEPNSFLPYPGKRPYPNALDPSDRNTDFDGDSLSLANEQMLWKYGIANGLAERTRTPLYYSDGEQYSQYERRPDGRRVPTLAASGYERHTNFLQWASDNGYRTVQLDDGWPWWAHDVVRSTYGLLDFNRDGVETDVRLPGYRQSEVYYYDYDSDGFLSDDERDEDADGLTNFDELRSRMTSAYWAACYSNEAPFPIVYAGTSATDPDSDGDLVRDGADDQDHDDIPNVMELSRLAASGLWDAEPGFTCKLAEGLPTPPDPNHSEAYGRVNPYNPCLPATWSRTCPRHRDLTSDPAPFDGSLDWASLN